MRYEDPGSSGRTWLLGSVDAKILSILQGEYGVLDPVHKVISIEFITADLILLCLKMLMHSQQHLCAVDLILESEKDQSLNLVGLMVFDEIRHIEINVAEVNGVILFHIFHVIEVEYEFVGTVAVEHNIEDIVDEINANYDLKGAVETVAEPFHVKLPINLIKVSVIHVKLLLKLKSDAVRGQSVKKSRQNNRPILTPLRKQNGDISITGLIQQCFTHHVCKRDSV